MDQPHHEFVETLKRVESQADFKSIELVREALLNTCDAYKIDKESGIAANELMAFTFRHDRSRGVTAKMPYFRPLAVHTDEDGKTISVPDPADVDEAVVEYWCGRAESTNALMSSRYADLVFEFSGRLRLQINRNRFAILAVDGYLKLVQQGSFRTDLEGVDLIHRALHLSLAVSYEDGITAAKNALLKWEHVHRRPSMLGTWGYCYDTLVAPKKVRLEAEEAGRIIAGLEEMLAGANNAGSEFQDAFAVQAAARRLAAHYINVEQDRASALRVLTTYSEAMKRASSANTPLVGAAWIRWVYDDLKKFGFHKEAQELSAEIVRLEKVAETRLTSFSHQMEISKEDVDRVVAFIVDSPLDEAIRKFVATFLPHKADVLSRLQEQRKNHPLMTLFGTSLLAKDGRTEAYVGGNEDEEGQLMQTVGRELQFHIYIDNCFTRFIERHAGNARLFADLFAESILWEASEMMAVEMSMLSFLRGEYGTCVHVQVPLIEATLRKLARYLEIPLQKKGRQGQVLKTLDEILREPKMATLLGEDAVFYMRAMLTDARSGWNVRNNVCHGLWPFDNLGSTLCIRLWHILMMFLMLRRTSKPPTGEAAS